MSRLLSSLLIALFIASPLAASTAQAKDFRDKYEPITLPLLTDFVVRSNLLPLDKKGNMLDYLAVTECEIYKIVKDSQFKQQEIQSAVMKKISQPIPGEGVLFVRLPTVFYISEYNFDTQSLTLATQSRMQRANTLELIGTTEAGCNDMDTSRMSIPALYSIHLNIPISFYRIPLKREIAETLVNKLDKQASGDRMSMIYGTMYLQIEPVSPVMETVYGSTRAILRGQMNVIDLFLDQDRKVLLRELDFDENY